MRLAGGMVAATVLAVGACATPPAAPSCPAGQEHMHTAQLFLGGGATGGQPVRETDVRSFVDQEITPRFPDGVTVLDGGGQWRGAENQLIREAQKVVLIVLPRKRGVQERLDAVRSAYRARFNQETVLVTQAACVAI